MSDFQQKSREEALKELSELITFSYEVSMLNLINLSDESIVSAPEDKSQALESTVVWDQIEVSDDLTVTFKDTNLSVQSVIDELDAKGVRVYRYHSFDQPGFLDQELAPKFRVLDTRASNEVSSNQVLEEAGLSTAPDNKLENLAAMLILYLKDKTDGVDLLDNERRLLNCYDNRNRLKGEAYRFVTCGASSSGVFIGEGGVVLASDPHYRSGKSRFVSALLSSRN